MLRKEPAAAPTPPPPASVEEGGSNLHDLRHRIQLSRERDLDDILNTATPPTVSAHNRAPSVDARDLPVNTGSAARWRQREGSPGNSSNHNSISKPILEKLATSDLVLQVAVMEEVHGVDVSWLHRPNKDTPHRKHAQSSPDVRRDLKVPPPPPAQNGEKPTGRRSPQPIQQDLSKLPSPPNVTPPTPAQPSRDTTHALPSTPTPATKHPHQQQGPTPPAQKRPSLLNRPSAERLSKDSSKKSSWMNSLSSKFSSTPERPGATPLQAQQPQTPPATNGGASHGLEAVEEAEPYIPSKPKESSSSFFSSLTRRLSAGSQAGGIPKVQGTGGVCARKVLNVDPNRERCLVPEMDSSRLRRVSFCVDVEIAGGPRYVDEEEDDEAKKKKKKEFKMKEKAEGAALKNPEALVEQKDAEAEAEANKGVARTLSKESTGSNGQEETAGATGNGGQEEERDTASRKREKKQKSEAERKDRKEKRRRRAEESGSVPVELMLDGNDEDTTAGSSPPGSSQGQQNTTPPLQPQPNASNAAARQDKPTTDPARIYRRCCQLRESPILKRITEQLSSPKCLLPQEPGVVNCLDLTGSRLQLADVVTLGDWLAVVPVKVLKLENADLNDEGVRCILAGLLAAKRPEPTKRRSTNPKHREGLSSRRTSYTERAGVVEKLNMKNNPRLTRVGWKHISLFIYMCRSLRAIDVSMNQFPEHLPPSAHVTPIKSPSSGGGQEIDAAEALYQCLSQRLGGRKLEELIMSECGLSSEQVRKIVDGAIVCGISRLGLAGNQLDDEGLEYVLHYLRSGICQALDLGGTDLRGKLALIADALSVKNNNDVSCWGLSLADCNLDSTSLKPLFAQLVKLPSFRFIDLSHNRDLCSTTDSGLISLLRRYLGQMHDLKRIHLADVGMSPKQAIALADALPDGPRLAHLSLLENGQLSALANARTEDEREEACALYASLMAAVRCSSTLICVDIDVPSADNSDVVKALAKQVVAYSLRNMEQFAIAEATGTENATALLTSPHGGEKGMKDFTVPDVLMQLVGHEEGSRENHDNDEPAPDEDYIVGGTGVVKALQYVLNEKANDSKRASLPPTPTGATPTGTITPKDRPGSSAGVVEPVQAKKMSKNLLGSARKIRDRLQPALVKEAHSGDELAYKRLQFLDQTLQSMIQRFEEEYPETRLTPASPKETKSEVSSLTDQSNTLASSVNTPGSELATSLTDEEDEDEGGIRPTASRHNSDVSLASRHLGMEEGRLHRLGQQLRREVLDSPGTVQFKDVPWQQREQEKHLRNVGERIENISGVDLRKLVDEEGWEEVLKKIGANYDDLRQLQEQDTEAWEAFRDAQEKARLNT